ncbi:MAG: Protein OS-9 [Thelocarpon superellum]|nr:MAG: Protein OS-9 [Thelocarpon superellum]
MERYLVLSVLITAVLGSQHVFSVHDDLLAFPQYDIVFSDAFISDHDADSQIAYAASRSAAHSRTTSAASRETTEAVQHAGELSHRPGTVRDEHAPDAEHHGFDDLAQTYEPMWLDGRRYLCAIPLVQEAARNESAEAAARAEEEKELERATSRGWELLQELEGQCLYYISGWWSYQFCYNGKVKQFHQLPPQKGIPFYPPTEDPTTPSYILGQAKSEDEEEEEEAEMRGELSRGRVGLESTELQEKGETRYLVQKLGAGTVCDLTGKDRSVEVQYHCNPQTQDRVGWIKEITTCSYLMVVYTPRLCDDVAFLPPRENRANTVACREVISASEVEDWKARKAAEAERRLLQGSTSDPSEPSPKSDHDPLPPDTAPDPAAPAPEARATLGGIEVGAKKRVGKAGRRIEGGAAVGGDGGVDIVAMSIGRAKGGKVERLNNEQLRRLNLDPAAVDDWRKQLEERAGEKGWRLEVEHVFGGEIKVRGIVDADPEDHGTSAAGGAPDGNEGEDTDGGEGEGSEEAYHEEL